MRLPTRLTDELQRRSTIEEPSGVCRALTDIDGNLGETYVCTDGVNLFFFSKEICGEFQIRLPGHSKETAMIDRRLRRTERRLLHQFREALQIAQADYDAIYDVLMLKNDLSIF